MDFIYEDEANRIIPVDVKSADNARTKSFATFCRQYKPAIGFRISTRNVGDNQREATHEISLPLYLLWKIRAYTDTAEESLSDKKLEG